MSSDVNEPMVLWDAERGEPIKELFHSKPVTWAKIDPDTGHIFAASSSGKGWLWNASGKLLLRLSHDNRIQGIQFGSSSTRILTWSLEGTAKLWDPQVGRLVGQMNHNKPVLGARFNSDQTYVLTWSEDGAVRLWDISAM